MKKRSMSLLALAVCVCLAGSSLNLVAASVESATPAAEEQTAETPVPTETVPAEEQVVSEEMKEEPAETPEITETPEPEEAEETPSEPAAAAEGPAKDIVDAREAEGGPEANYAYYSQDVVFEETTDPVTQKTVRILKIEGITPDEKMIVGVVNEDNSVTYYAYAPKDAGLPEGAICMGDVYNLGATDSDWYAFDADGHMVLSDIYTYSQNQNTYYFQMNGKKHIVNKTGCQQVEGIYCFFKNTQGAINTSKTCLKNIQEGKKTYTFYFDKGIMVSSQMVKVDSYFYYFDDAGHAATGRQKIDGKYYLFRTKKEGSARVGSAVTGWLKDGDYWYFYRKTDGSAVTGPGIEEIGSHKYYFTKTGKVFRGGRKKDEATGAAYFFKTQTSTSKPYMLTNRWIQKGSTWYYAQSSGKLAAGKKKITNSKGRDAKKGVYYFDEKTNKMLKNTTAPDNSGWLDDTGRRITKGWIKMNGNWRYLDNGQFVKKGWKKVGGYYYWFKKGYLCQDLRKKYKQQKRSGKDFRLEINRTTGNVTVFTYSTAKDGTNGQYIIPVVMFRCSVGNPETPTPVGTWPAWHVALSGGKWKLLNGPTWGQWAMGLVDGVLLHSTPGPQPNVYSVPRFDYNRLGYPASHGCIRFCVHDMKWLWDNVNGAFVHVFDRSTDTTMFQKPAMVPMAGNGAYGVDPTDPSVAGWKAVPHINPY